MYRETLRRIKELGAKLQNSGLSPSELSELRELRQSKAEYEEETRNQISNFRTQHPELIWQSFFSQHPEIADSHANRKALFERGLSLSDDDTVRPTHLEDAAKLLIAERAITPKRIPTAAELKQQAAKDLETFQQAAIQLGFSNNAANQQEVATLGFGYSIDDIAKAISSNTLHVSPVGDAEQQQRDERERHEILEEIIGARIITRQDRLKFESMPLEHLRAEVARIREERRLRSLTGTELRAHIRSQQVDQTETLPDDYTKAQLELMLATDDTGKIFKEGRNAFKDLCKRYGWRAIEERMGGYKPPAIAGVVRQIRHEFDMERV